MSRKNDEKVLQTFNLTRSLLTIDSKFDKSSPHFDFEKQMMKTSKSLGENLLQYLYMEKYNQSRWFFKSSLVDFYFL
jgi:hypothetical protein